MKTSRVGQIAMGNKIVYLICNDNNSKSKALISYSVSNSNLTFTVLGKNNKSLNEQTRKLYHNKISKMLQDNFSDKLLTVENFPINSVVP